MGVKDHQIHASEAAVLQTGEEAGPAHGVLTVPVVDAEDLTAALRCHSQGDHDRTQDDLLVYPRLDVVGIQEHVRERRMVEESLAHGCDLTVDVRTDRRYSRLRNARLAAERLDEVIDLPRRRA